MTLSEKILQLYRSWTLWVQRNQSYEESLFVVIDDLANKKTIPFNFCKRTEIADCFKKIVEECENGSDAMGQYFEYTLAKLRQSLNFIQRQSKLRVNREIIESSGTKWFPVSSQELLFLKKDVEEAKLQMAGENLGSKNKIESYLYEPLSHHQVAGDIASFAKPFLSRILREYPMLKSFEFETKEMSSPHAAWRNLVTHNGEKFVLVVNTPSHHLYTKAIIESLALHEICGHMIHLTKLASSKELQKNYPHLLAIAIHTQDSYLAEGIAQLLAALLVSSSLKSSFIRVGFKLFVMQFAVRHANILDRVLGRISAKEAIERHQELLGGDRETVKNSYEWILQNPFFCVQVLNYHSAYNALLPVLRFSESVQKKIIFKLLTGFYSYGELDDLVKNFHHSAI